MPKPSRILVTGGAGFIGSHIVETLLFSDYPVTVLDDFSTGSLENIKPFLKNILLIRGDIRCRSDIRKALKGVRIVLHQAAIRSVPRSVDNPLLSHDVNATGTLILLEEAARSGVKRFVYASSSSVYGNTKRFPQREDDFIQPLSPYGTSKLAGEHYAYSAYKNFGLGTVSLRYFNVYGPRQNPESKYSAVIPAFIHRIQSGKRPIIDGTGRQSRDFTYVGDVVSANLKAAFGPPSVEGEVFNIAGGGEISVLEILRLLKKHFGKIPKPVFGPRRKGDVDRTFADIGKARRLLHWNPACSFEVGLRRTLSWFLKRS